MYQKDNKQARTAEGNKRTESVETCMAHYEEESGSQFLSVAYNSFP